MSTKHITAYYLDAQDGRPANEAPLRHGPVAPSATLEIDAVDRRQDPALIIGRIPADEPLSAGMALISQEEHQALVTDVQQWRDANAERELAKRRESMEVTRFQARAVLRQMGLREQVDTMMADPAADPLAVDAWTDAQAFKRTSPTIALLASQLGLSDAELDDMFERAADIEA
jgi:AraC-like DNA-binding protein